MLQNIHFDYPSPVSWNNTAEKSLKNLHPSLDVHLILWVGTQTVFNWISFCANSIELFLRGGEQQKQHNGI